MSLEISFSVSNYLNAFKALSEKLDLDSFLSGIELIHKIHKAGKKIFTCGNGGSASTASHYITDWNKMVNLATGDKFRGFSLCDNIGLITAFSNDIGYDEIFIGQLKSIMTEGDLVIGISGSGNSPSVIRAIEYANEIGGRTLAVVGYDGGKLKQIAQQAVWIPSFDMQLCEEFHLIFGHMTMKSLCGSSIKSNYEKEYI
jgi:D-sedoheptulose 7-phosphate isomerase